MAISLTIQIGDTSDPEARVYLTYTTRILTATFTFSAPIQEGSFTRADVKLVPPPPGYRDGIGVNFGPLTRESNTVYKLQVTTNSNDGIRPDTELNQLMVYHKDILDANGQPGSDNATDNTKSPHVNLETERPKISAIVLSDNSLCADQIVTVSFTFNTDAIAGFGVEDIVIPANCTLVPNSLRQIARGINPIPTGRFWTAEMKVNHTAPSSTGNAILVHNTGVQDRHGISGVGDSNTEPGSGYNHPPDFAHYNHNPVYTVDGQRPALNAAADGATVNGDQLVLRYDQVLDAVNGPVAARFTVGVGTDPFNNRIVVTAVAVNGQTVTLTLARPVSDGQRVVVAYVDPQAFDDNTNGVVQNLAGSDAESFTFREVRNDTDTTPPVFNNAMVDGGDLVLTYTEVNHLNATDKAAPGAFVVLVNGVARTVAEVIVNGANKTVTLKLATAVIHGDTVTVNYTDPTAGNDPNAIQDVAGNDAASFTTPAAVTNNTPDNTAPALLTTGANAPRVSGNELVLTYTDTSNLATATAASLAAAFAVRVNGAANAVTGVTVDAAAKTVTLRLTNPVTGGETVTVAYTKPASGPAIQDAAGNQAASTTEPVSVTPPPDTTPPVFNSATVDGRDLVLTYTEANHLNVTDKVAPGAFTVLANGVAHTVTEVIVNDVNKTVTLKLATAVIHRDTVTVNYTDPTTGNDPDAIQDTAGNDAASFTTPAAVTNNTTDITPPALVTTGAIAGAEAPSVNGRLLVLFYTDTSNLGDGDAAPPADAFTVRVNGVARAVTRVVVNAASKTITLILPTVVTHGDTVTVSYTDPTPNDDPRAVQDAVGNDAPTFTNQQVTNYTPDIAPPVLITTGANAPQVSGNQLALTYDDTSKLGAGTAAPPTTAFTVRVDGVLNLVAAVSVTGKTVTLLLTTAVAHGQKVTVSYADPSASDDPRAIQDTAGNDAASFVDQQVINNAVAPSPVDPQTPVTPRPPAPQDNDGVPDALEDQIPGITGPGGAAPVAGDGNGDGIKDSQQSTVGSMNGMTLVISSQYGKPTSTDASVRIVSMEQKAAPANLPKGLEMPIGSLSFETQLAAAGSTESFSLYVDPAQGLNGYWVQDRAGVWVNLASVPYGGNMVAEGGRLRLDFKITDGGQFDADGKADGVVTAAGAAGHMQLSMVGQAHDLAQFGFWF